MIDGVRGRLITAGFAESRLLDHTEAAAPPPPIVHALDVWSDRRHAALGPAASVRAICDAAVLPLLKILGFDIRRRTDEGPGTVVHAGSDSLTVPVVIAPWNAPLDTAWRAAVLDGIRADARWCLCCNGAALRLVDAHHTWTRQYLEFDLTLLPHRESARRLFWCLLRADAMAGRPSFLERMVELSAGHGAGVCSALGSGVLDALVTLVGALSAREPAGAPRILFEQSLTVLYRVLFLLFAEARGLVPVWHQAYRERYTIEEIVTTLLAGRRYAGIWETVLAVFRMAHAGCVAGDLEVTAFNGRLFSPAQSSVFDRRRIGDRTMGEAIVALGSTPSPGGRTRISYRDLDVEQLGAVYERVLEYEPAAGARPGGPSRPPREAGRVLARNRDARQSSGTFYTPRLLTAVLVRRTLEPLVRGRSPEDILRLRVLDPAMGSGAFLVAACRYLAAAAEEGLIRDGRWHQGDVTRSDRTALRREIALRCLFGVDVNPMAVQLARLSLWLGTLASDRPLTFLDHHLVVGDSLVGASLDDLARQPTRTLRPRGRPAVLPLYADPDLTQVLQHAVRTRLRLSGAPDESAAVVANKERTLEELHGAHSPLGRWAGVLDLWCAGWFWDAPPLTPGLFGELCDRLLQRPGMLATPVTERLLERARAAAASHRFLHWPMAFPEVFSDEQGASLPAPGFDAVIGNPPWDMVRGDSGDRDVRADRKRLAGRFTSFAREAGIYRLDTRSHVNRYQLFTERALQLAKPGGRIGLVLPSGILSDAGASALRRHLFDRANVDSITGFDNRGRFFPIHRSLRFVLLTGTTGQPTDAIACRFGVSRHEDLQGDGPGSLTITRRMLARISGADDLGIPEVATERDLRIVEAISDRIPWAGDADGWNVRFGRELNATDDRGSFRPVRGGPGARPVLEGKQIQPFRAMLDECRYEVAAVDAARIPRRARLAYRDVASATNRLTLIAAVVPPRVVTTHTLFCLKPALPAAAQHVLCALFNSFVANYLIRLRVHTHVTAALVARLPLPFVDSSQPVFGRLALLARTLMNRGAAVEDMDEYAEVQATAARLYGVSAADFDHILGTLPLIPAHVRERSLQKFGTLGRPDAAAPARSRPALR